MGDLTNPSAIACREWQIINHRKQEKKIALWVEKKRGRIVKCLWGLSFPLRKVGMRQKRRISLLRKKCEKKIRGRSTNGSCRTNVHFIGKVTDSGCFHGCSWSRSEFALLRWILKKTTRWTHWLHFVYTASQPSGQWNLSNLPPRSPSLSLWETI